MTSISDSAGQSIVLSYDGQGRVTQAAGLGGETVTYTYTTDGLGNLAQADRNRAGSHSIYSYTYNADPTTTDDDHLLAIGHHARPGVAGHDDDRRLQAATTVRTDARGNTFQNSFDSQTRTTTTTDTTNDTTTVMQTDSQGRPTVVADQLGRTTQYYYDVERVYGSQYPGGWTYVQFSGTNRQPSLVKLPDPSRPGSTMNTTPTAT